MLPRTSASRATKRPATGLIRQGDSDTWKQVDAQPFEFRHSLAGHPLFSIESLARLSERAFERTDYGRYFKPADMVLPRSMLKKRLRNDIEEIAENGKWVSLHYIDEMEPAYEELFDLLLADIEELVQRPVRSRMTWGSMSVFLNAPGLKVPYHFDHETNFLMQVLGEKQVKLYPRALDTLSIAEIEDFYRHNPMAGVYRDDLAGTGSAWSLTPGVGVHHPPLAPHSIDNGKDVSVSLSLYYVMPEMENVGHVHQANYCMRKLGLHPRLPGESAFADRAKAGMMRALSTSKPRTHDEMLYSGISRLSAPFRLAKHLSGTYRRANVST